MQYAILESHTVFNFKNGYYLLVMPIYIVQHVLMTSYLIMDSFLLTFLFCNNFRLFTEKLQVQKNSHLPLTQIPQFLAGDRFCFVFFF